MAVITVGEEIAKLRKEKGLTQGELGAMCGTTKQTIYKYENNIVTNIPIDRLWKICAALGTTPSRLFGRSRDEISAAHNLAAVREEAKLSLAEAAQQAGVTAEQLEQIETGAVPLSETMLIRLCAVYDVHPERILVLDVEQQEERYEMRQQDEQIAEYRRQLQKEQPAELNLDELSPTKRELIEIIRKLPEDQLRILAAAAQAMCEHD